jgi:uncharacterized protein YcbK (DUF882 family)
MATLLRATPSSQLIQNRYADERDLSRMRDVSMIEGFHRSGYLVRVPASTRHYYLHFVSAKHRYLRPWSKLLLDRLSRQYYARFEKKLRVTSLVRTVALQRSLAKRNGNADAAYGARASSHLTGATLDISKRGMTAREVNWMRGVIYKLRKQGYLYAVEEFSQPVFHIMVYRHYPQSLKASTRKAAKR